MVLLYKLSTFIFFLNLSLVIITEKWDNGKSGTFTVSSLEFTEYLKILS